ncbi:MAG TPA: isoprenyl transferase [Bacteroides sp.]|nr:isoprenyl transferase [Phocaeicola coprophilus]HBB07753.1 isoprenyl transferase [Bacteroides sp.]
MSYKEQIDQSRVPTHVAIIMDGNGRWAKQHNQHRSYGHKAGVETVRNITKIAAEAGVKFLTLYTFSTENWNRPAEEVTALMTLLLESIEEEIFMNNNIAFRVIGDMGRLPEAVRTRLEQCIQRTSANTRMTMVIALSYSSKWEITQAVRQIASEVKEGTLPVESIDEALVSRHLTTNFMPDPDLLIRTGGELRLSNYLLWQCAYSELYFCDTFWPDFNEEEFYKAIYEYQQRERRFGKTSEQVLHE